MAKACTYQPLSSLYFIAEGDFAISDHYCYYHMFQINAMIVMSLETTL